MPRINPLAAIPVDAPLCASGKRPFRTQDDAERGLASARHGRGKHGGRTGQVEAGAYRCPCCTWWHLTSATRPRRRADFNYRHPGNR